MADFQREKQIVLAYFDAMEQAAPEEAGRVLSSYAAENYDWKGSYPFRSLHGAAEVADAFWVPLKEALSRMQRRQDIFIAGHNALCPSEIWVMSMGNFMGNFTGDFLGIRHTGKLITLRYVEFAHVEHEKIRASGIFVDMIGFMAQAGVNPLPKMEGACFVYPGPREHDGLLYEDADEAESKATLQLIGDMCNETAPWDARGDAPPQGRESAYWAEDMLWYGTTGAAYTISEFEKGQRDFRRTLCDRKFVGHVTRFAEGNFGCFFGWPSIINTPVGGYLGLPGGRCPAEMQVVEVYARRGDKIAENWAITDIPYWLAQQGLEVFPACAEGKRA